MATILELAPVLADADKSEFPLVQGIWHSAEQTEGLAEARGHTYRRQAFGGVTIDDLRQALADSDAVIVAPTVASAVGLQHPSDGNESGRRIGHSLLDVVSAEFPELHVVLVSHFVVGHGLVGHGPGRKNARPKTWGLRALEAHLRAGRNTWTILRPTGLSPVHDESYQVRLTDDQHADGLVSRDSLADAVVTAIENLDAAGGRTASVFNVSCPRAARIDLVSRFRALTPDWEVAQARESISVPV